jgi:hypothetical protein
MKYEMLLPGVSVRLLTFAYVPPAPPIPPTVLLAEPLVPPCPPPITSMVLAALFQSDGTFQEVPELRTMTVEANACAGNEERKATQRTGNTHSAPTRNFLDTMSL